MMDSLLVYAQVASAPYSPEQVLVNPAAGGTRLFKGLSLSLAREEEDSILHLNEDVKLNTETVIKRMDLHLIMNWQIFYMEAFYSPQKGKQIKTTNYSSGESRSNEENYNTINLHTLQFLTGLNLFDLFDLGVKKLYSNTNFETKYEFEARFGSFVYSENSQLKLDADYQVDGLGTSLKIFKTGLSIGFVREKIKLRRDLDSTNTYGDGSSTQSGYTSSYKDVGRVYKNTFGISYSLGNPKRNSLRFEYSKEKMPTLGQGNGVNNNQQSVEQEFLDEGELDRFLVEGTWLKFHGGVDVRKIKGFYVDSLNLIPYYLTFENFSNESRLDVGFFGGLRSSKGHSFGLSYFQSKSSTKKRADLSSTTKYPTDIKNQSFGLSYGFIY
jgi:hypothetical protein